MGKIIFLKSEYDTNGEDFVLSLSWPGSTCKLKNCQYLGRKNYFSLHGLWPEYKFECDHIHYKMSDLSPQNQRDVPQYWSSMYNTEMGFINHELSKHGSCWEPERSDPDQCPMAIAQILNTVRPHQSQNERLNAFIQVAIAWSKTNDLFTILKDAGMNPSENDVFSPADLMGALSQHFGVDDAAFPVCRGTKHQRYLSEVRFCLDNNFQIMSCGAKNVQNHIQSCGHGIFYPEFPVLD